MRNIMNLPMLLTKSDMTFSERAQEALTMVVMGMVMVFLVLAIIMLVLMLMERVFAKGTSGKKTADAPKPVSKTPEPVPVPVAPTVSDDGAVIAAITAAISAMLAAENGTESYQGGFRVVSFKRSTRNTPWNSAK